MAPSRERRRIRDSADLQIITRMLRVIVRSCVKLDQAASFVPSHFELERTSARYTGHDIATMIAA
jgi:hypothetical protein